MKQEYSLILIIGLLVIAYVLEAVVNPFTLVLPTQFHYINPEVLTQYPFSFTIIAIRGIAAFMIPTWLLTFMDRNYTAKAVIALVLAGLSELYALQELATGANILPLEWTLALALAGILLLPMVIVYFMKNLLSGAHKKLTGQEETPTSQ